MRGETTFVDLPQVQNQVFSQALRGAQVPDLDVAQLAYEWAQEELARSKWRVAGVVALDFLGGMLTGGSGGSALGINRRRHARAMQRLGPPGRLRDTDPPPLA